MCMQSSGNVFEHPGLKCKWQQGHPSNRCTDVSASVLVPGACLPACTMISIAPLCLQLRLYLLARPHQMCWPRRASGA